VRFLPAPAGDATVRLVLGGPAYLFALDSAGSPVNDVSLLTAPSSGAVDTQVVLQGAGDFSSCILAPPCPHVLADGRLLLMQLQPRTSPITPTTYELFRIDPVTTESTDLGRTGFVQISPAGTRLLLAGLADGDGARLRELDDRETTIPANHPGEFLGEDLYFGTFTKLDTGQDIESLQRLRAGSTTVETVADNLALHQLFQPSAGAPVLVVGRWTDTMNDRTFSLLDLETLRETPFPAGLEAYFPKSISASGRWLALAGPYDVTDSSPLVMLDRATGATELAQAAISYNDLGQSAWRPVHDELWSVLFPQSGLGTLSIWRPGAGATGFGSLVYANYPRLPDGEASPFTRDGRYWFVANFPGINMSSTSVGPADDPAAATFPLNAVGTDSGVHWELDDGRLLIEASVFVDRNDISLVDPATGASRPLADGGHVVALGHSRALALLDWVAGAGTGDLTLIDLDTGGRTLIAENVFDLSLEPAPAASGGDLLASGLRVAFLVRNRIPSPFDGVWVATLP
jgi:hypothetical protein